MTEKTFKVLSIKSNIWKGEREKERMTIGWNKEEWRGGKETYTLEGEGVLVVRTIIQGVDWERKNNGERNGEREG